MKTKALYIALIFVLAISTVAMAASVEPTLVDPWQSGDAAFECGQAGFSTEFSFKVEPWDEGDPSKGYDADGGNTIGIVANEDEDEYKTFDWTSVFPVDGVIVKAGTQALVYTYGGAFSDTSLYAPDDKGISHVTFCYDKAYEGQWCSPGYWRQPHHLDSWTATGYSPDDLFIDVFGYYPPVSKLGSTNEATTNPTLWQVLQSPQYYGGDAFNLVGDELSDAHPDVDFLGIRVEDSCPLN